MLNKAIEIAARAHTRQLDIREKLAQYKKQRDKK